MRRALVGLVAVGLLATGCGGGTEGTPTAAAKQKSTNPTTTTSRPPFEGEELTDGEVVAAAQLDGVSLESPDDGELRNYGVGVEVLDFGTADVVDTGENGQYGAKEDSTLLAFRLRVTAFAENIADKVTATVSVDGKQRELPDFEYALNTANEDETLQYLVAVPKDRREVELALKYADLAQTFDLLEGKRTGEQPEILYRAADKPTLYLENLTPAKVEVSDDEGGPGTYIVAVTNATLTYFTPELGDQPADDKKAWLIISYEPTSDGSIDDDGVSASSCTLPFASFKLTDGDGADYAVVDKHSAMEEFDSDKVLTFEVPADLAKATLTIAPTSFTCVSGLDYTYTVTKNATVDLEFPED